MWLIEEDLRDPLPGWVRYIARCGNGRVYGFARVPVFVQRGPLHAWLPVGHDNRLIELTHKPRYCPHGATPRESLSCVVGYDDALDVIMGVHELAGDIAMEEIDTPCPECGHTPATHLEIIDGHIWLCPACGHQELTAGVDIEAQLNALSRHDSKLAESWRASLGI